MSILKSEEKKINYKETKDLSVLETVSLINLEGKGLLGKAGIDARIFSVMALLKISVSIISQGSSERGIGIVVSFDRAAEALQGLEKEFSKELIFGDVSRVSVDNNIAAISISGQDLSTFHNLYSSLIRNKITPILFNNIITGNSVSLVIKKFDLKRALNIINVEIFGHTKKINIAVFGHGLVGGTLIDQMLSSAKNIEVKKGLKLNIFAIVNSTKLLITESGINENWKAEIATNGVAYAIQDVIKYAKENHLENLIAVDNTASSDFVENYVTLIENGFDVVSSNKIANTLTYGFYKKIRQVLQDNQKNYLYETNVGAGLPLIDTIKLLHLSGENITKIKGVFSGTLSYIFNYFSVEDKPFSKILKEAIALGFTEPDPREDLCGNDVARKLLILARELDLQNEFNEIEIQNLIPAELRSLTTSNFLENLQLLDFHYKTIKENQEKGNVLRYIGELSGDLQLDKGNLEVKLVSVPESCALGQLKGSDSIFEIYTESYGERPIVIQGAGAGASVTARGVFGDILRIIDKI
jgi:aspartokinase/homoserine dehydrogenase 1